MILTELQLNLKFEGENQNKGTLILTHPQACLLIHISRKLTTFVVGNKNIELTIFKSCLE